MRNQGGGQSLGVAVLSLLVLLLFVNINAATSATKRGTSSGPIRIFIVPHSHDDVGW